MKKTGIAIQFLFFLVIKFNPYQVWTSHLQVLFYLFIYFFNFLKNISDPRFFSSLRASSKANAVAYILPTAQAGVNNKARTDVEASPWFFFSRIIQVRSFFPASRWHQCAAVDEAWITIQAAFQHILRVCKIIFLYACDSKPGFAGSSACTRPAAPAGAGNTLT